MAPPPVHIPSFYRPDRGIGSSNAPIGATRLCGVDSGGVAAG